MTCSSRSLSEGWTLRPVGAAPVTGPIPASVPGCVHTDLLAAGLIPDPYVDDNEERTDWIGRTAWQYETIFDWSPGDEERVDLVCAGLDTDAAVTLGGIEIGRTANMHRSYRFPIRDVLRTGQNVLTVRFGNVYAYTEALKAALGDRPSATGEPYNFVRKMAANFGWDWGPKLVTAGIWRPIGLHAWHTARFDEVRPLVTVDAGTGLVDLRVVLQRAADVPVVLTATVGDTRTSVVIEDGALEATATLAVADPELWWPRGYGEQPRYDLDVQLRTVSGETLDGWTRRIGFRSVTVDTATDDAGRAFTIVVNDVPVFVRGANWIPADTFPSRVSRERYAARITDAVEANLNCLRVWGGGIYETEDFYDLADELGVLIQQDFLFACATYPEEEPLRSEVVAEAREQVARLASHPSLVLWAGNNENLWGYQDWGWQDRLHGRSWGHTYYLETLPAIVAELDPTRPYWPGSPYSGTEDVHPNDPAHGTCHIWDVWFTHDYTHYRAHAPRFVAEFGYQGPAAYATLCRAISDDPLAPDSPGMLHHQKAENGHEKLARGLDTHLPRPNDFDDWHFLTQVNQARAIRLGLEHFRSLRPHCMGTIVWQLNDCWPAISWSAVDSDGRRKPVWYGLREAYSDRLVTIQPDVGGLSLVAVNDTGEPWFAPVTVRRVGLAGDVRASATIEMAVRGRSATRLTLPSRLSTPDDRYAELIVADSDGRRAVWFFAEDRDIRYPAAAFVATVEQLAGGACVTVRATTILRDLTLLPDRIEPAATVDRALVTLLPRESAVFTVHAPTTLDAAALTTRPVLRCVNERPQQQRLWPGDQPPGR